MDKKVVTPDFYQAFTCLAGSCPDTCCKGWDIVVDDETLDFYDSLNDENIKKNLAVDEDGDTVLRFVGGVCPFLTGGGLCDIQSNFGGDKLCAVCRTFPRITQDYTEFEERLLTLACPQAARLMITSGCRFDFIADTSVVRTDNGYSGELMNFLLHARFLTAEIFRSDEPFSEKLRRSFALTASVQRLLDDESFTAAPHEDTSAEKLSHDEIFDMHRSMDVMDSDWLTQVESVRSCIRPDTLDGELSSLALYYIARYYLTAVSTYDVITTMVRLQSACEVCACLISAENAQQNAARRALIYQKYSKEIEHSDENLDLFTAKAEEILPL